MTHFPELFQHIHKTYGIELNNLQATVIEKVLLSRNAFLKLPENHREFVNSLPEHDFITEQALLKGTRLGLSRATIFRILANESIFLKIGHGLYQRLF